MTQQIPAQCDVLIIGGGPAGASAATLLAKAGIDTVVLEKAQHPREQVGESLIPHFWKYTDQLGVSQAIDQQNFVRKAGGITVWNDLIHRISFADFGFTRPALHVERDVFDELLIRHAQDSGAAVFESVQVKRIKLNNPISQIEYLDKRGEASVKNSIRCRYVLDASGYQTVLARELDSKRQVEQHHRYISIWGHFRNSRYVAADGKSYGSESLSSVKPVTFVLSFEEGWIWHIPLRDKTSVGLVLDNSKVRGMSQQQREAYFLKTCATVPYLRDLLEPAEFIPASLRARPDYSYYVEPVCGDNYYCIGDSGGFVDPIFSHGVLNAFYSSALAAIAVQESLNNPAQRQRCAKLCENRIRQFYSFSRALALGDFHTNGANFELICSFMRSVPAIELELMLAASHVTQRSANFRRLMESAGLAGQHSSVADKARLIECLQL